MGDLRFADVAEGVKATIAAYVLALDDGRTDDIVELFCPDGSVDIPGLGAAEGPDAIHAAYAAIEPKAPQRHLVVNTHVTDWSDDEASAVSDLVFMVPGGSGWQVLLVGRYTDTFRRDGDRWLIHRRLGEFVQT